ncbi:MAG: metal-dependent transcriptional regulator [Candidatus Poribacteria bacterium]
MADTQPTSPATLGSARVKLSSVLTHAMEDYIKVIYKLQRQHGRATTIAIADEMGFSAASATNMLQKLARLDLAIYAPYKGAELTDTGERIALEVIRHHRLLELYLSKQLGYSWDAVDAEAEALEHVISEEFEERIDELLGRPQTDPHGHPIPTKDGRISDLTMYPALTDVPDGSLVHVRRVSDSDPAALRRLGSLGLYPGVQARVVSRDAACVVVHVDGADRSVEVEYAGGLYVEVEVDGEE